MSDRPINFRAPEIRALLDGRKVQDRRILKPQPQVLNNGVWYRPYPVLRPRQWTYLHGDRVTGYAEVPYAVGDRLWVREAFRGDAGYDAYPPREWSHWPVSYEADPFEARIGLDVGRLRPSIHMPRWASRLTLTVTDVRVQRIQDITEADAVAEGIEQARSGRFYNPTMSKSAAAHLGGMFYGPRPAFEVLWNSIHGPEAWTANPWCVALTFETHRCNIDQMPGGNHE